MSNYPFIPIGSVSGVTATQTETAGAAITAFDLVAFNASGQVVPAISTTSSGTWDVAGVAQTAAVALATLPVTELSGLQVPVRFAVAPAAINNGDPVFLSSTAGVATLSPPTTSGNSIFRAGILVGADGATLTPEVMFRPQFISSIP